eukprot:4883268-Prymnesium_polylepis.1
MRAGGTPKRKPSLRPPFALGRNSSNATPRSPPLSPKSSPKSCKQALCGVGGSSSATPPVASASSETLRERLQELEKIQALIPLHEEMAQKAKSDADSAVSLLEASKTSQPLIVRLGSLLHKQQ